MKDEGLLNEVIHATGARKEELIKEFAEVLDNLERDGFFEAPSTMIQPAPLTLEQIKRMDGESVVIPYAGIFRGGIGVVELSNDRITDRLCALRGWWPLSGYGKEYVAFPVDFSADEVPDDK